VTQRISNAAANYCFGLMGCRQLSIPGPTCKECSVIGLSSITRRKLILFGLNPLTQQGENQVISMLFPMETVFEAYVAAKLPLQLHGWKVSTQATGRALVDDHLNRRMFSLRPDLSFKKAQTRVIGDTKWKLINQANRSDKYGISQADIYQLFGYTKKYLDEQVQKEVLLIYPASDTFTKPLKPFWYREHDEVLHVVPYDLDSETLRSCMWFPTISILRP
jgi:5-methylcytosine-specific restriction enzyme subunit McrC